MDLIPFVKDGGYQHRDKVTGMIKTESGKSVSEYLRLLKFNMD